MPLFLLPGLSQSPADAASAALHLPRQSVRETPAGAMPLQGRLP